MIEPEYQRFLQTLSSKETSDNVRKIGNIVLTNINTPEEFESNNTQIL